ncbi:GGDEF domain-containing protein [Methylobacterium sp. Leaf466]|uniref:GGDEF domain-containing protein n=1 Tax=Methylobacterium sp. Leaf466 TaxID=1736386 RepID=UPI000A841045|nr:GGDEF domain-containing protein [Methylobacterium sp. Leaf466]
MRAKAGAAMVQAPVVQGPVVQGPVIQGPAVEEFSLYDAEEAVLVSTTEMLAGLTEMAGGVRSLADSYRRSLREQKRLVRMSDRMQSELQKANHCLAEQRRDLQSLNEALEGEIRHRTRLEGELRRLADMDDLTGAHARRHFLEVGEREWARHRLSQAPICVLMLDLDRFKRLNDGFGHGAGDAALKAFVAACRDRLRPDDVIGRMGGEEFAVLLPGADRLTGLAVAETIREAVAATEVAWDGATLSITVSVGAAAAVAGESIEAALRRADAALYFAKHTGRNCVCDAAEPMPGMV